MTDETGQTGPAPAMPRRVAIGAAVTAAVGLLASVGFTAFGPDAADAPTVLVSSRVTDVVLADGSTQLLDDGEQVPRGATVRTGQGGTAMLRTRGRDVLLGASTSVTVVDGARQVLARGLVLVDATDAPGVTIDGQAADVAVADGGLTRLERGPAALRVAVFDGRAKVRSSGRSGRRSVDRLFQVKVPYGGLAGTTTPLVLTNDDWEQRYALDLVQDDRDLRALATGLDGAGDQGALVLQTVPASVRTDAGGGAPRSESLIPYLLATNATEGGRTVEQRYDTARGYRQDGGSWGVVAALVDAGADDAGRALDAMLGPDLVALPDGSGQPDPSGVVGPGAAATTPPAPDETSRPGSPPTRRPSSSPSPTPSPTSEPDAVDELIDTVVDLLPTPLPVPLPSRPPLPVPLPTPGSGVVVSVPDSFVGLAVGLTG